MVNFPKISVIVPVYNTEKYLHRCINSVLVQTYTDFELLLIDDGSKDSSGTICDEYAAQDTRVRVFHKENGGVSSARNLGLGNAQGEWITFVDSDDYIEENFLKSFEGYFDADLIVGNMMDMSSNKNLLEDIVEGYYYSLCDVLKGNFTNLVFQSSCGKLFRTRLSRNIQFDEKMASGEDFHFILRYLCVAKSLRVLSVGRCTCHNHYIYLPPQNFNKKHQISVQSSVHHMIKLEEVYQTLGIKDIGFEILIVRESYERCVNDISENGYLWYKNRDVERICLRCSAHKGLIQWLRTWLSFNVFFRIKMYQAKRHKY